MHAAEIYLIIVLFVFGTLACFLLPVNGGYDEEEHLIRVWEMSDYTFLPNEKLGNKLPFPRVYREMSYRREFIVRAVPADFWEKYGNLSLDSMDYIYNADTGRVVVSSSVSNTDLPQKTWYALTFTPVMDSLGKLYLFNIRVGSGDGQGARIAYSLKQEYIEGNLYENSDDINRDVIFQMGCVAGWKK